MNLLQISHPAILDWRTVEEIASDECADYIAHPSFPTYPGLLVRLQSPHFALYAGIYGEDGCVNVSPYSPFAQAIDDHEQIDMSIDYATLWHSTHRADWMLNSIAKYLSTQEQCRLMCDISRRVLSHTGQYQARYTEIFDEITTYDEAKAREIFHEMWNSELFNEQYCAVIALRFAPKILFESYENDLALCAHYTARALTLADYTQDNEGFQPTYERHLSDIADDLRRWISFYDIAIRITRHL